MPHAIPQTHSAFYPHRSSRCSFYRTVEEQATDKEAQTLFSGDFGKETRREQCIQLVGNCDKLISLF